MWSWQKAYCSQWERTGRWRSQRRASMEKAQWSKMACCVFTDVHCLWWLKAKWDKCWTYAMSAACLSAINVLMDCTGRWQSQSSWEKALRIFKYQMFLVLLVWTATFVASLFVISLNITLGSSKTISFEPPEVMSTNLSPLMVAPLLEALNFSKIFSVYHLTIVFHCRVCSWHIVCRGKNLSASQEWRFHTCQSKANTGMCIFYGFTLYHVLIWPW